MYTQQLPGYPVESEKFLAPALCKHRNGGEDVLKEQNADRERQVCAIGIDVHYELNVVAHEPGAHEPRLKHFNPRMSSPACPYNYTGKFVQESMHEKYKGDPISLGREIEKVTPYDPALYDKRDPRKISEDGGGARLRLQGPDRHPRHGQHCPGRPQSLPRPVHCLPRGVRVQPLWPLHALLPRDAGQGLPEDAREQRGAQSRVLGCVHVGAGRPGHLRGRGRRHLRLRLHPRLEPADGDAAQQPDAGGSRHDRAGDLAGHLPTCASASSSTSRRSTTCATTGAAASAPRRRTCWRC